MVKYEAWSGFALPQKYAVKKGTPMLTEVMLGSEVIVDVFCFFFMCMFHILW